VATQKHEYLVELLDGRLGPDEQTLYINQIASYGWRLIATDPVPYGHQVRLHFERPVEASDG
jgi:hypothetical protein